MEVARSAWKRHVCNPLRGLSHKDQLLLCNEEALLLHYETYTSNNRHMGGLCSKAKAKAHGKEPNHPVHTPPDPHPSTYGARADATEVEKEGKTMSTKDFVDSTIKNGKVVVWSKSYCPYCKKAKDALFSILPKDAVDVEELDQRPDGDEIQDYLLQLTGGRSVPRVFIGGKFIGGGDDTVRLKKSGQLQKMLGDVGVPVPA